jgi:hypothetical protein
MKAWRQTFILLFRRSRVRAAVATTFESHTASKVAGLLLVCFPVTRAKSYTKCTLNALLRDMGMRKPRRGGLGKESLSGDWQVGTSIIE